MFAAEVVLFASIAMNIADINQGDPFMSGMELKDPPTPNFQNFPHP
jgi:hypothetical protein